jgi:hypothetical protein
VIELLAIADGAGTAPPPLRVVEADGLGAVCAEPAAEPATAEALWRRETLLEALMEERALLPVRFGTVLRDEAEVARAVRERSRELRAGLERVRGAVELSVRVFEPDGAAEPRSGAEYLARAGDGARVHARLAALARAAVRRPAPELLRGAYLVERGRVEAFVAEVERIPSAVCTGPWPPYSFAEEAV